MSEYTKWDYSQNTDDEIAVFSVESNANICIISDDIPVKAAECYAKQIALEHNAYPQMYEALKDVLERVDKCDAWWIDCPDKGGIDTDRIEQAIVSAEGKE